MLPFDLLGINNGKWKSVNLYLPSQILDLGKFLFSSCGPKSFEATRLQLSWMFNFLRRTGSRNLIFGMCVFVTFYNFWQISIEAKVNTGILSGCGQAYLGMFKLLQSDESTIPQLVEVYNCFSYVAGYY